MEPKTDHKVEIHNQQYEEETEIDLFELLMHFRSRLGYIILFFILGGAIFGSIAYFLITPKYEATSKLYMVSASNDSIVNLSDLNLGTSMSEDYAELLVTRPVILSVLHELKLEEKYEYDDLIEMLNIAVIGNTRILAITATSTDPAEAEQIANCLAQKGTRYIPVVMETSQPNIAEEAIVPKKKSSPNVKIWAIAGAFGLGIVCMIFLTVGYLRDDTLKTAEDIEKFLGVMPLSVVPEGNDTKESRKNKTKKKGKGA